MNKPTLFRLIDEVEEVESETPATSNKPEEAVDDAKPPTFDVSGINRIAGRLVEVLSEEGMECSLPTVTLGVQQGLLLYQVSILQALGKLPK